MMSEEQLANIGRWLKDGHAKTVFAMWEKFLSADFANGDKGWQLYKECWTMVHKNAPHEVAEFQRRFSHLPDLYEMKRTIPTEPLVQTAGKMTQEAEASKSWFSQVFSA
jgi:hypothetical protein